MDWLEVVQLRNSIQVPELKSVFGGKSGRRLSAILVSRGDSKKLERTYVAFQLLAVAVLLG